VKNNNVYRVVPLGMLAFSLNALAAEGCPTAADEIATDRPDTTNYPTHTEPLEFINLGGSYRITHTMQLDFHSGIGIDRGGPNQDRLSSIWQSPKALCSAGTA
jgi:hypothetical protein